MRYNKDSPSRSIMYTISELLQIQKQASTKSNHPGALVISKSALVNYIDSKVPDKFTLSLLNQAISLYCGRGHAVKLVMGTKKWNLDASKVPAFLDWFFEKYNPEFRKLLEERFEARHLSGKESYQRRAKPVTPKKINLRAI